MPFTRDELVQRHIGLVHYLARRLHATLADEADLDELVSAGLAGLLAAADAFDSSRGLAFSTYAATRIRGAMLDELRRVDPLTRGARSRARRLEHVRDALAQTMHRTPTTHEVADALDTDILGLLAWERESLDSTHISLDATAGPQRNDAPSREERIPAIDPDLDLELDRERERERLREALHSLDRDALEVLILSFFEDRTLREIAPRIGVTESGVSRIRARALRQLRDRLTAPVRVA
ncbi:MAG TPA: sigma-70 family RNA polymerase sigma factor [Gemmatimonadaceae bacterium]|nr:sigma-70 family RNA polymerase sigma factor [Gemmatimonadaceae bacterium]HRQ79231.1 sigma-70 family RNA polymerase sigma factor [Gemmatimonadaceae bacterium]